MVTRALAEDGFVVFDPNAETLAWAEAAHQAALTVLAGGGERRHGETWFVGVDALPNASDGSVSGVPLRGPFLEHIKQPDSWHAAQLSVVFPGYPRQDADESDAAHRYRLHRDAAHVDGLLPEGPQKRRHLREPHGFILGLALNDCAASPLVVWKGSHRLMQEGFARAFAGLAPAVWGDVDVTEIYQETRRKVFDTCERVAVHAAPGQAILLDRHLLHGVAPWGAVAGQMRMVAYFRPIICYADWL
ncbi:hypothetical protein [Yoonia sp.]|uniref:hypothetical protein n=1 Tax=Yoonia sp. TaxID=2212373 RepID=UPI002FDA11BA